MVVTSFQFKMNTGFMQRLNNNKFSSKFFFKYGLNLGGHLRFLDLTTSSIVYGVRFFNSILNNNYSLLELSKVLKIIEGIGYDRGVIYVINSILSLQGIFKSTYGFFNKNIFLPLSAKIFNPLKDPVIYRFNRKKIENLIANFELKSLFFFTLGRTLRRKFFVASKWTNGFLSNNKGFYSFSQNVLHEKIKDGKMLEQFEGKVQDLFDIYPSLPQYGVIGDHRMNFWIVNEFTQAWVPNSSAVDNFTNKAMFSFYGIPANGCSTDSFFFFLSMSLMSYFAGYNRYILKFNLLNFICNKTKFLKHSKNFYFRKFVSFEKKYF